MIGRYLCLAVPALVFFSRNRDARLKRRVFRILLPIAWVWCQLFILLTAWPHVEALVLLVPATVLIFWLWGRNTKFCDACGAVTTGSNWFYNWSGFVRDCPKCGVPFPQ
jgi:hypothetical protein